MEVNTEDFNKLKELEESLWKSETRFDLEYMGKVLSPEFFEFGRSGKVYARKDTLYGARPQVINAKFPLKNFKVEMIAENVALVTYISEVTYEKVEVGNRSSIWIKTPSGWQLRFHQGTPVEDK